MSATNSTPIINLPLFIGSDKPAWLIDWNNAMNIIDSNISSLQSAESGTAASLAALSQSVQALSGTVDQHTTALQTLTTSVSGNTGSINTINSLIGNGQPTTTDKTIIGAINEINAKIPEGSEAAIDVTYNNTSSGLAATNVQAAIDEVNAKIPEGGEAVTKQVVTNAATGADGFDNTNLLLDSALNGKIPMSVTIQTAGYFGRVHRMSAGTGYAIQILNTNGTAPDVGTPVSYTVFLS